VPRQGEKRQATTEMAAWQLDGIVLGIPGQVLPAVLQKFSQREEHLIKFLCTFSAALKIPQATVLQGGNNKLISADSAGSMGVCHSDSGESHTNESFDFKTSQSFSDKTVPHFMSSTVAFMACSAVQSSPELCWHGTHSRPCVYMYILWVGKSIYMYIAHFRANEATKPTDKVFNLRF